MCERGDVDFSYGLSWNKVKEGNILSASEDTTVAHWWVTSSRVLITGTFSPTTRQILRCSQCESIRVILPTSG